MIAETLAGIALVKSAVDGIKSAIGTAQDISDIASHVDNLFEGEKQVQQQRAKKSGTGLADQFGIKTVAQEMIDAKLAKEKMQEMATIIDMRFGHGTWAGIVAERAKRIQEAKEAALAARREALKRQQEFMETAKIILAVVVVAGIALGFLIFAITASAMAYSLIT
jgi:hypothetical protein